MTRITGDVFVGQFVVIRNLYKLIGGINEKRAVIGLAAFQHHDAGRNRGAEEQVARQLNDAVNKVVINQILTDFLFCAAAVHNAGEADDCRRSIGGKP